MNIFPQFAVFYTNEQVKYPMKTQAIMLQKLKIFNKIKIFCGYIQYNARLRVQRQFLSQKLYKNDNIVYFCGFTGNIMLK